MLTLKRDKIDYKETHLLVKHLLQNGAKCNTCIDSIYYSTPLMKSIGHHLKQMKQPFSSSILELIASETNTVLVFDSLVHLMISYTGVYYDELLLRSTLKPLFENTGTLTVTSLKVDTVFDLVTLSFIEMDTSLTITINDQELNFYCRDTKYPNNDFAVRFVKCLQQLICESCIVQCGIYTAKDDTPEPIEDIVETIANFSEQPMSLQKICVFEIRRRISGKYKKNKCLANSTIFAIIGEVGCVMHVNHVIDA